MSEILFRIGDIPVSVGLALALGGGLVLAMLASLTLSARRAAQDRAAEAEESFAQARELEARLRDLARIQAETTGRVQSMAEVLAQRQSDLARAVSERLDSTSHRLGESFNTAARATHESLTKLAERLVMVEKAEKSLA
ncbi:MAG: DNA recombinase, partial [Azorhizobium sp. 32-67-21]